MLLNINDIMNIIPHRPPFLLVDAIDSIEGANKIIGHHCVSMSEPFFQGHFPKNPVMPGVLIIEALAQTGAVLLLSRDENKGKTAYFASIEKAKFRKRVFPGDVLRLEIILDKVKGAFGVGRATAYVEDTVAVEATLMFAVE